MRSRIVQSAWANIGFFSPPTRNGNTEKCKKTSTSSIDHKKETVYGI